MNNLLLQLSGVAALLLLNALLVACEFSVIKLRLSHFNEDILDRIRHSKGASFLLENADAAIRVARLGVILCTFGYAFLVYSLIASRFPGEALSQPGRLSFLSLFLAVLLALAVQYVFSEVIPRNLAVAFPVKALRISSWAVKTIRPFLSLFFIPLHALARLLLKPFGLKPESEWESLGLEEQLRALGKDDAESPVLPKILKNVLQLRDIKVLDILLPRNQVMYFDLEDEIAANLDLAARSGHTRFPLCEGDLDHCLGLIHIKDLFRASRDRETLDFRSLKRDIIRVNPRDSLEDALQKLLLSKTHMALVVDEFGGIDGVITMELVLEQLVGEIQDEFDAEEDLISSLNDREFLVSGLTPIRDLEEKLDLEIENKDDVATFSGLITAALGRIPGKKESLSLPHLEILITEVDETRVIAALVVKKRESGKGE